MTHSYSLSLGSFGGETITQGVYLNTMRYQLTDPLSVHLQLGIGHQALGGQFRNAQNTTEIFISRAGFEYKPTKNLKLQMEYSKLPGSTYYQSSPFLDPISRRRDWYDRKNQTDDQKSKGSNSAE